MCPWLLGLRIDLWPVATVNDVTPGSRPHHKMAPQLYNIRRRVIGFSVWPQRVSEDDLQEVQGDAIPLNGYPCCNYSDSLFMLSDGPQHNKYGIVRGSEVRLTRSSRRNSCSNRAPVFCRISRRFSASA